MKNIKLFVILMFVSCYLYAQPSSEILSDETLLETAIMENNLEEVTALLNAGIDPNYLNSKNIPFLDMAIDLDRGEIITLLITRGADINRRKKDGETPLIRAIQWARFESLKALVESNVDVNCEVPTWSSPVIIALNKYDDTGKEIYKKIALFLLDNNADPDKSGVSRLTPLIWAIYLRDYDLIELLLQSGANPDKSSISGRLPIQYAARIKGSLKVEVIELLVQYGAKIKIEKKKRQMR